MMISSETTRTSLQDPFWEREALMASASFLCPGKEQTMPIYRRCGRCGTRYETGQQCPRCAALVTQDNRIRYRQYDKYRRDKEAKKFYDSEEWKITRAYVLALDELDVYEYMTNGKEIPADTVHHIIPYRDDNTKALDPDNLMSLSAASHAAVEALYKVDKQTEERKLREMLEKFRKLKG